MGSGLQFKGAYTWSKTLTKNGARTTGNVGQVQDPFNLSNENSFSSDHLPHRFTGNFIYELPFGRASRSEAISPALRTSSSAAGVFPES